MLVPAAWHCLRQCIKYLLRFRRDANSNFGCLLLSRLQTKMTEFMRERERDYTYPALRLIQVMVCLCANAMQRCYKCRTAIRCSRHLNCFVFTLLAAYKVDLWQSEVLNFCRGSCRQDCPVLLRFSLGSCIQDV